MSILQRVRAINPFRFGVSAVLAVGWLRRAIKSDTLKWDDTENWVDGSYPDPRPVPTLTFVGSHASFYPSKNPIPLEVWEDRFFQGYEAADRMAALDISLDPYDLTELPETIALSSNHWDGVALDKDTWIGCGHNGTKITTTALKVVGGTLTELDQWVDPTGTGYRSIVGHTHIASGYMVQTRGSAQGAFQLLYFDGSTIESKDIFTPSGSTAAYVSACDQSTGRHWIYYGKGTDRYVGVLEVVADALVLKSEVLLETDEQFSKYLPLDDKLICGSQERVMKFTYDSGTEILTKDLTKTHPFTPSLMRLAQEVVPNVHLILGYGRGSWAGSLWWIEDTGAGNKFIFTEVPDISADLETYGVGDMVFSSFGGKDYVHFACYDNKTIRTYEITV